MTNSRSAALWVALGLSLTCCANAHAQQRALPSTSINQQVLSLDFTNNGQHFAATVGQRIEITLGTVGPNRYGDPQVSSSAIRLESIALVVPPNPGGPTFIYMFDAATPGEVQVKFSLISEIPDMARAVAFAVTIRVGSGAGQLAALQASMTPDQANTAPWTNASIILHSYLLQTFTPSLPLLTAVEVELVVANPGPSNGEVIMTLANAEGVPLAEVTKTVPVADCRRVLFHLPHGGLRVSPGQVYVITLSSVDTVFGWKYVLGGYANGAASLNGIPGRPLSRDTRTTFLFRTFGKT